MRSGPNTNLSFLSWAGYSSRQQRMNSCERLLGLIQMDHSYAKPWTCRTEGTSTCLPTRTLFPARPHTACLPVGRKESRTFLILYFLTSQISLPLCFVPNSCPGPWRFDMDPYSRIRSTGLRIRILLFFGFHDANKNYFFWFLLSWVPVHIHRTSKITSH
jgi:hypothetical protein